jgi:cytochrome c oxidase assembly factor CtaG/putative copper export protein
MSTTSAPARSSAPPAAPLPRLPRVVWALAAAFAVLGSAVALGVVWTPSEEGLPDAGRLVVDGLPVLRLAAMLSGGALLGFALSAVALDPGAAGDSAGMITTSGRRDLAVAAGSAVALAGASLAYALFTLSDVLGLPLGQLTPAIITTYLWDVDGSRAALGTAALAAAAAVGLWMSRSLGSAAVWGLVAGVAVGLPGLTGHAAGLGGHSVALISGMLHIVATSLWAGGLVALVTHAAMRDPDMAERVRRFGVVAIVSVAVIAVTGFAAAATRLDAPAQLLTTAYGRTVLAKIVALGVAGGLGLLARRAWRSGGGLSATRMLAEVAVLGVALGLAVALARSAFPREILALPSAGEELIGYVYPPPPTFANVALGWHPDWVWLAVAMLAIWLYVTGYLLLRIRGDAWPVGRLVAWVLGWLVVIWATCAGVAWYAPVSFALHMVSHMALAMMAPVLLVLGGPITLALRVLPAASNGARGPREWISWALGTSFTRFVTHPLYVLFIYTIGLYGLYYTSLYERLMTSHLGHFAMQVHFLAAGYLFYWVVIGVDAGPRRLGYPARLILLMASLVIHSLFAVPMMMSETPMVQGWYDLVQPPWLTDPLQDTRVAGAVAWGFGELPTLIVAIALGIQWARADDREARRQDRRADLDGDAELRAYNERLARLNARGQAPSGSTTPRRAAGTRSNRGPGRRGGS